MPALPPSPGRPDPRGRLQHVQIAAGSDAGAGPRVWSSLWHEGKRTDCVELGGFRHKVRVSAVKKAKSLGVGITKGSLRRREEGYHREKKKKKTTKEKTVKGRAIMGMNSSFFCPVAGCQSLPHTFLSATKTSPHGHTCLETNSFGLEKLWALLQ